MKKYQNMSNWISIILFIIIWTFSSCTNHSETVKNSKVTVLKDTSEIIDNKKIIIQDTLANGNNNLIVKEDSVRISLRQQESQLKRNKLKANGIYSYFYCDTFYIYNDNGLLIAKRHFESSTNNPNLNNNIIERNYWIEQSKLDSNLYVSLYIGGATPFKSYLIDLKTNQIIIENEDYQTYLGSSLNKNYHLFETGTGASLRSFAIFNSKNELLKKSSYYTGVSDTNQLKWKSNKFYYYYDYKKGSVLPKDLPELKMQEIYVQKYYWTNNKDSITNDFSVAFVE